jgi:hypothetical protein
MSQGFWVGKIVDRNEFDIAVLERSSKYVSPDTSESVDSYFDCHLASENLMKTPRGRVLVVERKENGNRELKNAANCGQPTTEN